MTKEEYNKIFGIEEPDFDPFGEELEEIIKIKEDDPLVSALKEATHLNKEEKQKYMELATLFLREMTTNIFKNQFELSDAYPKYTIDEWNDFLNDRIVSVYINKHKRTMLKAVADKNLSDPVAKNKRDNLQLIRNIEEQEQSEQNRNICIIRIPDKYADE